jgi:DNA invertase Pin-like site-specific DNA recombinase
MVCDKILRGHRERLAIIYVRQSTVQQDERHQESTRLQYALVDRALQFGWMQKQIIVIDDDWALGFQHRGSFGLPAAGCGGWARQCRTGCRVEMSRLARSCRDWHQLLEICALFDTLIADADGVYDPANYNDRLLLGLKGTMSEAELHILKARLLEGRRAKAKRGELGKAVPMGYLRRPSGEVVLDPDEQAQTTIHLVFDLFDRFRTISKVMTYLTENDIRMPVRVRSGPCKGELEWHSVNRASDRRLCKASGKRVPVDREMEVALSHPVSWLHREAFSRDFGARSQVHVGLHLDEDVPAIERLIGKGDQTRRTPAQASTAAFARHDAASGWLEARMARGPAGIRSHRHDG